MAFHASAELFGGILCFWPAFAWLVFASYQQALCTPGWLSFPYLVHILLLVSQRICRVYQGICLPRLGLVCRLEACLSASYASAIPGLRIHFSVAFSQGLKTFGLVSFLRLFQPVFHGLFHRSRT